MIGAFSNRLFVVQYTAPIIAVALIVLIISRNYKIKNALILARASVLVFCAFFGSLLGYFQYLLSVHQCGDVASSMTLPDFSGYAKNWVVLAGQPFSFFLIVGLLLVCAGIYFLCLYLSKTVIDDYLLRQALCLSFVGLATAVTSLLYLFLPENLLDRNLWRYLVVPAFALPFGTACFLSMFVSNALGPEGTRILPLRMISFAPKSTLLCLNMASVLRLGYISFVSIYSIYSISSRYQEDYASQSSWLNKVLNSNGLRGSLGFVADPPWESRRLYALSDGGILALSVSTDGNPLIFPHSRYEFVRSQEKMLRSLPLTM